jgi:CRISPR-associated protein Cmr4
MFKKELTTILNFYAISPIHAGSGMSTGAVDLPIQREKHTNWPHIQASAVKGAIRAHFRNFSEDNEMINLIFGSDNKNDSSKNGASDDLPASISISDAKLLAFPVRSNIAPFVWVTSPAILKRLERDLLFLGVEEKFPLVPFKNNEAVRLTDFDAGKIILEDSVIEANTMLRIEFFKENYPQIERLLLVSDEVFDYLVTNATEIQTQITIDHNTGTAKDGALRYQELLPSDSLLYSVVYFSKTSKVDNELKAEMVKSHLEKSLNNFMQIGGDETLGRGICKLSWLKGE